LGCLLKRLQFFMYSARYFCPIFANIREHRGIILQDNSRHSLFERPVWRQAALCLPLLKSAFVGVHEFQCNLLYFVLGFQSLHLEQALGSFPFVSQTHVDITDKLFTAHTV
jgi:hypothetical protein